MYVFLSILCTLFVCSSLFYIVIRKPYLLVKLSTIFLIFFCFQVQISSALNADSIYQVLEYPWVYFLLVHGFSCFCLFIVLFFNRSLAKNIFDRIGNKVPTLPILSLGMVCVFMLIVDYIIVAIYLHYVPFNKTGFYAAIFKPELLDSYRQLSFRLIDNSALLYLFTFLTKILAPITSSVCVVFAVLAWKRRFYLLSIVGWVGLVFAIWPAMLYGARGPGAMVVVAAVFAWFLVFGRKFSVILFVSSTFLILAPPIFIQVAKSAEISPSMIISQTWNVLDRAVGRGYIDNVWHLKRVEASGFDGFRAIEKIAILLGYEPVDSFALVAKENSTTKYRVVEGGIDIAQSASAGASFVVMNYTMFGLSSLLLSISIIFGMDIVLLGYRYIDDTILFAAVSASAIPALSLSFCLFTTVMASKGWLLIPLVCFVIGKVGKPLYLVRGKLC